MRFFNRTFLAAFCAIALIPRAGRAQSPFQPNSPPGEIIACISSLGNDVFIGTWHGVYRTTDSGSHWQRVSNGLPDAAVYSLAAQGHSVFAIVQSGIYRSTDSGLTWTSAWTPLVPQDFYGGVLGSNASAIFLLNGQYLNISTDAGTSWNMVDTNLTMVAQPQTMLTVGATTYLAGSWIIATNSNGKYWQVVAVPPSDEFWEVSSLANIGNMLFVANDGQMQRSSDSGTNWNFTGEEYGPLLATLGTQLFAYGYEYVSIYRSSDSGKKWVFSANGLPQQISIQCLMPNAGVLYAGTDGLGMYRSLDSGKTWSACNTGLDQTISELGTHRRVSKSELWPDNR